jgi:hypothetical protein
MTSAEMIGESTIIEPETYLYSDDEIVEENEGRISEESDESTEIEEFPTENDTKTEQNPPTLFYNGSTYINIDNNTVDTQERIEMGEPELPVIVEDRFGRQRDSGQFKPRKPDRKQGYRPQITPLPQPSFLHRHSSQDETNLSANFALLNIEKENNRRSSTFIEKSGKLDIMTHRP